MDPLRTFEEGCGSGRGELTDPMLSHPNIVANSFFKKSVQDVLKNRIEPDRLWSMRHRHKPFVPRFRRV